jgi:hypothetical protein
VKNQNGNVPAWLLQIWSDHQVAGIVRVRSPKFHDNVDAIRFRALIGDLSPQIPFGVKQALFPQDVLTVELSGSAVAGDIESVVLQVYYPDLPGQNARLLDWAGSAGADGEPDRAAHRHDDREHGGLQRRARHQRGHRPAEGQHRLCAARRHDRRGDGGDHGEGAGHRQRPRGGSWRAGAHPSLRITGSSGSRSRPASR